jgi:hypothetical protein
MPSPYFAQKPGAIPTTQPWQNSSITLDSHQRLSSPRVADNAKLHRTGAKMCAARWCHHRPRLCDPHNDKSLRTSHGGAV